MDASELPFEGAPVHGRAAIVAAAAAHREVVPVGSLIRVYWAGSDEEFDTKVLGHRAQLVDGSLCFKHQCECAHALPFPNTATCGKGSDVAQLRRTMSAAS